ncbi:transcriptional repressor [Cellulophaga phage phi18:3]|uniref:DNA-binding helix-turn-helix protein n=1 Tax=Cellulophaga phage phi18:3 TaxID=1327983 RepID=S0A269_9CAUD|nr:transcriptional repressor [Cellulophaga phage phi18:3]AGO48552.1 DNA-binding helix-turn-helix protein [Cellulophaga phage phi18:3]
MAQTYIDHTETEQEIIMQFADYVSERMQNLGITQGFISRETGISQGDISKIIRGLKRPSIVTASRILKAINSEINFNAKR